MQNRKDLFRKNYELLKDFVPEILNDRSIECIIEHKQSEFDNVISLSAATTKVYAETITNRTLCIGMDNITGDYDKCDPMFIVIFDNNKELARVTTWMSENEDLFISCGEQITEFYDFESEESEDLYEANNYLYKWLLDAVCDRREERYEFKLSDTRLGKSHFKTITERIDKRYREELQKNQQQQQ